MPRALTLRWLSSGSSTSSNTVKVRSRIPRSKQGRILCLPAWRNLSLQLILLHCAILANLLPSRATDHHYLSIFRKSQPQILTSDRRHSFSSWSWYWRISKTTYLPMITRLRQTSWIIMASVDCITITNCRSTKKRFLSSNSKHKTS